MEIRDSFARRARLGLLDEIQDAGVLPEGAHATFESLIEAEIASGLDGPNDEPYEILELARMRAGLGPWSPPISLRGVFLNA